MGLRKGMTNNRAGKPVGTKNKLNSELREKIGDFLDGQFDTVMDAFTRLEPKDKVKAFADLLQYALPKLQATSLDATIELERRIDSMTEDELNEVIEKLLERV